MHKAVKDRDPAKLTRSTHKAVAKALPLRVFLMRKLIILSNQGAMPTDRAIRGTLPHDHIKEDAVISRRGGETTRVA